jgi:sugar-specific transcriptional regulator TrmB
LWYVVVDRVHNGLSDIVVVAPSVECGTEARMDWAELLDAMGRFGFAEREAKLYLLLLRRGRATARDLTRDSKIDRVLAYRTLDAMRARGLVQTTAERPRRYVPLAPKALFERSLFERRRSLEEDVTLARELSERLPELTAAVAEQAPRFQVITGTAAIYPFLREMVRRAQKELLVMVTPKALRESARAGVQEELPRLLRGGGRFQLLVEPDARVSSLIQRFLAYRTKFPKATIRGIQPQRARLTIVDGNEAMVFLVPESTNSGVEEIAVWTDTRDFVAAQMAYFNAIWSIAQPFRTSGRAHRSVERRRSLAGRRP